MKQTNDNVIQQGENRFHYIEYGGKGTPLVFLAGLGNTAHIFDSFAPRFVNRFRVLAFTRRGFGASSQPTNGYDTATLTDDIAQNLDALQIERAILVGHSIAGGELTRFATRYPERTIAISYLEAAYDRTGLNQRLLKMLLMDALPPVAPGASKKERASAQDYQKYLLRTRGVLWPDSEIVATQLFNSSGQQIKERTPNAITQKVVQAEYHPDFSQIKSPVLNIYATRRGIDQDFPWIKHIGINQGRLRDQIRRFQNVQSDYESDQRKRFRRALSTAQVCELAGASHYVFLSHPDQTEQRMTDFFQQIKELR